MPGQLDQRFEGKFGRGDVVLPVGRGVAVAAGVGYEKIEVSQRDPLLDAAAMPVLDSNGRFVTDPASPRRIAYNTDGIFWDAGVLWRPSRRTSLEARVGRRYGSMTYTGSLSYADRSPAAACRSACTTASRPSAQQLQRLADAAADQLRQHRAIRSATSSAAASSAPRGGAAGGCLN